MLNPQYEWMHSEPQCSCRIREHADRVTSLTTQAIEEIVRHSTPAMANARPEMFAHTSLVNQGSYKSTLAVTLYAAAHKNQIVSPLEAFPRPVQASRCRRYTDHIDITHPIISCLQHLLSTNEEWVAMKENLTKSARGGGLSLGNIMSRCEPVPNVLATSPQGCALDDVSFTTGLRHPQTSLA